MKVRASFSAVYHIAYEFCHSFLEMVSAARETASTPSLYLIAARNVHSALDYALRQSEKMVAYPDLINATGPDFCEPLHSPHLHNQTLVPPVSHGDTPDLAAQADPGEGLGLLTHEVAIIQTAVIVGTYVAVRETTHSRHCYSRHFYVCHRQSRSW